MKSKNKTFLLILDGPMGTGKTTTSKLLNEKLEGTARVGLDDIKRFVSGEKKNNRLGWEIAMIVANGYLERGVSVIVESAMKEEHVEGFVKIAKKNNARYFVYQFHASKDLLLKRVKERTRVLLKKKKLPKENIKNVEEHFEIHYTFHTENKYNNVTLLNSEKLNSSQIIRRILKDIK